MLANEGLKSLPTQIEVINARGSSTGMLELGQRSVDHVLRHQTEFNREWIERLIMAEATLQDAIDANEPSQTATAGLFFEMLRPVHRSLSPSEAADLLEPSETEIEGWAWGIDLADTTKLLAIAAICALVALLSFSTIVYGLDAPGTKATVTFGALGGVTLAVGAALLGRALFKRYVIRASISWSYQGYPAAKVSRPNFSWSHRIWGPWYAYSLGGFFLAAGIALIVIIGREQAAPITSDYTPIRLSLLASTAIGVMLSSYGAWPIVRSIVVQAEIDKRTHASRLSTSPRLLLTILPLIAGAIAFLINWIFS